MAYSFDPELMNSSLATMGSSYRAPVSYAQALDQTAAPPERATFATQAPAPTPPPRQVTDAEVAGQQSAPSLTDEAVKANAGQSMQPVQKEQKKDGMQRLGSLVGAVLSAYTGNYMGAASGLQQASGK